MGIMPDAVQDSDNLFNTSSPAHEMDVSSIQLESFALCT